MLQKYLIKCLINSIMFIFVQLFHSRFLNYYFFFLHTGDALKTGGLQSKVVICGTHVPELLSLEVADNKLVIGSAVTMTALEIYLEELCKTSSGTCVIFILRHLEN